MFGALTKMLVLASPLRRLLDPTTTMRYKHVCREEQTHRATQMADGAQNANDPAMTALKLENASPKETITTLRDRQTDIDTFTRLQAINDELRMRNDNIQAALVERQTDNARLEQANADLLSMQELSLIHI